MPNIDPISVECPNCDSPPGEKCTQPTEFARKHVSWFHYAREGRALTLTEELLGSEEKP